MAVGITAAVALTVVGVVTGIQYYIEQGAERVFLVPVFTILSFLFWYLLHNLIHELFHALFCKLSHGRITAIAFWGLELNFLKGEKRIKFSPKSAYAGYTEFVCKRPNASHLTLYMATFGGLVGSMITLAAIAVWLLLAKTFLLSYFALMGFVPVFYMIYLNFFCDMPSSDGRLMIGKSGKKEFAAAALRLETEAYLFEGKTLMEARPVYMKKTFGDMKIMIGYDYLCCLELKNIDLAKQVLSLLKKEEYADNEVIDPLSERFFIACIEKDDGFIEQNLEKVSYLFDETDINSLRVHAAYRKYTGDSKWAELLTQSYFKACADITVTGLKESYREIGERLL